MKHKLPIVLFLFAFLATTSIQAQRVMEQLNRGLVAVRVTSTQTFLSWRVLGSDPDDVAFNLYRNDTKITETPVSTSSNYVDNMYLPGTRYTVKTVINGVENGEMHEAIVWANNYLEIPLNRPGSMTMPDGSTCTYSPNDASVGDVDGDGNYDIILKWEPSNAKDNSQSGYTGNVYIDAYKLDGTHLWRIDLGINIRAGAHYTQFMVADFDGDGKAEVAMKTAPGTRDASGNFISKGPAATANHAADYRNSGGYILTGPEYFTVFSGETGLELATASYDPPRGTVSSWGDNYGNRVDRFLASVAWLDGVLPSIVMMRGYYTRSVVAAWDFRNGQLTKRWTYDSGTSNVGLFGQGFHSTSVGDVDNDGRDEIIWGAAAVNHDGKLMYRTNLGHGDAMHLSDLDPDRPGLEMFAVHESSGAAYGYEMHDARTGEILWGVRTGTDVGRGVAANLLANNRGFEMWSTGSGGIFDIRGNQVNTSRPAVNFRIYWTGDLQSELLDGTTISKYLSGNIFSAAGTASNNGTKSTPSLSADILGDWREEVIFRTTDNTKLRIYTTTAVTNHKMYTLMHDDVYRNAIAWQNTAYNQPPHAGFYIGADMDTPPASAVYNNELRWAGGTTWDASAMAWKDSVGLSTRFDQGDKVLFDLTAGAHANIQLNGTLNPAYLKVNSPFDVTLNGNGTLAGAMYVRKTGAGKLTFNNHNTFTGNVTAWSGALHNNGTLAAANVSVKGFTLLGANGTFQGNVNVGHNATVMLGAAINQAGTMRVGQNLTDEGKVDYTFDFIIQNGTVTAHDSIIVGGNWTINNRTSFHMKGVNGNIPAGNYTIGEFGGTFTGDLAKIAVSGISSGMSHYLTIENNKIILVVKNPAALVWNGTTDARWDIATSKNWLEGDKDQFFISNDTVLFNDNAPVKSVLISESVAPAQIIVDAAANYTFGGSGSISGTGDIIKRNTGRLTLSGSNDFTGKTIINDGILEIASIADAATPSPIGAGTGASDQLVIDGGRLNYAGISRSTNRGITLGEKGATIAVNSASATLTTTGRVTGPGQLVKEGAGRLAFGTLNNYTGGTIIRGGSIGLTTDIANTSGLGTDTITLMGGSIVMFNSEATANTSNWKLNIPEGQTGSLITDGNSTIAGSIHGGGTLNYFTHHTANMLSSDVSAFSGILNITTDSDGGNFVVYNTKGYPQTRIHLNNMVTMFYRVTTNVTIPIGELTGHSNSVLGAGGSGVCRINWEVGARNVNSTFSGVINNTQFSGSGAVAAITKVGTGVWTLTNANTFTGGTAVKDGTLMVNNTSGSGLGSGAVTVTDSGILSGRGSIQAPVTVSDGGTLAPGDGIGTFTVLNNDVTIEQTGSLEVDIDKNGGKVDMLTISGGKLTMGGNLTINAVNPESLVPGDKFKIINATINGSPSSISPNFPANNEQLAWDLSDFANGNVGVKVNDAVGLHNPVLSYGLHPNPFTDYLQITLGQTVMHLKATLYSLTGSMLIQEELSNTNMIRLKTDMLERGAYMLEIKADDETISTKLLKK